jgi:deoxyuridine 5'-triphosphate nucleotidohydrolase
MTWLLNIIKNEEFLRPLYKQKIEQRKEEFEYLGTQDIDSGFDLFVPPCPETEDGNWKVPGNKTLFIPMGIKLVRYKDGQEFSSPYIIHPRSSIWKNKPIRLANCAGIIDAGYRGELGIAFDNIGLYSFVVEKGWRLVQACEPNLEPFKVEFIDHLDDTVRGEGGFGSSGQ